MCNTADDLSRSPRDQRTEWQLATFYTPDQGNGLAHVSSRVVTGADRRGGVGGLPHAVAAGWLASSTTPPSRQRGDRQVLRRQARAREVADCRRSARAAVTCARSTAAGGGVPRRGSRSNAHSATAAASTSATLTTTIAAIPCASSPTRVVDPRASRRPVHSESRCFMPPGRGEGACCVAKTRPHRDPPIRRSSALRRTGRARATRACTVPADSPTVIAICSNVRSCA